jgi:hypothetical protein
MKSMDFTSYYLIITILSTILISGIILIFSGIFYFSDLIVQIVFIAIGTIILIIDLISLKYLFQTVIKSN